MCDLSSREREILQLLWDGMSTKEMASALNLSVYYIKNVQERLRLKLQAHSKVLIVRRALEQGLIQVGKQL